MSPLVTYKWNPLCGPDTFYIPCLLHSRGKIKIPARPLSIENNVFLLAERSNKPCAV